MSDQASTFSRVMIAVDKSEASQWALEAAGNLAGRVGAAVALVHVVDLSKGFSPELGVLDERLLGEQRVASAEILDRAERSLPQGLPVARIVREGDPAAEIVAAAQDWRADLVALGTHARGPVARFLLGSTAEAVVRRAQCAVLTVGHKPATSACEGGCDCDEQMRVAQQA